MYPEDACSEALINAVAHRDYSIEGRGIEIFVFDDRMEVISPGALLSTVKLDELRKLQDLHQSRNPLVARVLREVGYMKEMGEGMRRIYGLMRQYDLVAPELRSDASRFLITLSHKSVFSDSDQRWLDGYKALKLNREEMLVALMGKNGDRISAQEIYDRLGLVDWDVFRAIIDQLITKGIVYKAISGKKVGSSMRGRITRRAVPRFMIRQPEECEKALADLFQVLGQAPSVNLVTQVFLKNVRRKISADNPYNSDRMGALLRILSLIDENREPTALLQHIWITQARTVSPSVEMENQSLTDRQLRSSTERTAKTRAQPAQGAHTSTESNPAKPLKVHPMRLINDLNTIYVANFSPDVSREDIRGLFEGFGKVSDISMPKADCAFVKMEKHTDAAEALRTLKEKAFRGRRLRVFSATWPEG